MPGLALIAGTVWGAAGVLAHSPDGDPTGRQRGLAVLVRGGRVVAVVPAGEAGSLGADRVVDLGDVTLMPGFVDAHVHLTTTGLALRGADLGGTRSAAELLERVRAVAGRRDAGGPIWGDGYDEGTFTTPGLPGPRELAAAAGNRPAYLSRVDGHQGLATLDLLAAAGALEAAGCERGPDGAPTGVVRDDANHRARRHAHDLLPDAAVAAAQDCALAHAARRGVACVHEMAGPAIAGRRDFELLLDRVDALPIEVVCYWGGLELEYVLERKLSQIGGDLFLDGSLGSHTAALSTPYEDRPDTRGSLYLEDADLTDLYVRATMAGVQVGVHAIGDLAIGQALRCARRAVHTMGRAAFAACRHRIEHVELLGSDGADRLADLGLAASVQPAFDAAWGRPGGMYERRLGQRRAQSMNPFGDLWRRGVPMGGSSDSRVTPLEPWHGVAAAVHHHRRRQRLGLPVALELFTLGGRLLARQEQVTGRIEPGQRADLTAFAGDVLAVEPRKLVGAEAVFTMVGGRLAHGPEELCLETASNFGGWSRPVEY
ncbi:MAG TPA: amidohydrolase family protein [Actinomycetes bacterium]|nr:amidohydrolase family protein [Actinomycetes bacterium]